MNNKGFTLLELLAVLTILALIALIITPVVTKIVDESRKETAARSLEGYVHSVNNALGEYAMLNKGNYPETFDDIKNVIKVSNTENIQITNIEFPEGTVTTAKANVDDYSCTYSINSGAVCS